MTIIAIDPGATQSAFVEWDGVTILRSEKRSNDAVEEWLHATDVETVLIEWITSYGMRVGSEVFDTCRWVGRFEAASAVESLLVPRREVKMWHCGRPSAKDADVTGALKEKYGEKGTKKNPGLTYSLKADLWQAFALAAYWTEKNRA